MKKYCIQESVAKKQFKLYLEEAVIERLTDAGLKYGRGTPQQVIEEMIDLYFPLWSAVNVSTLRAMDQQTQLITKAAAPPAGRSVSSAAKHPIVHVNNSSPKKRETG